MRNILLQSKSFGFVIAFLAANLAFVGGAWGQMNTWDGSSSNNWNTAANWSLDLVPTAAHDVVIDINAAISVNTNATINSLTINNSAVVSFTSSGADRTITIDNTGSAINAGSSLTLQGSTGSGTRFMAIAYTGANRTMSIAGTLTLTAVGEGTIYTATNSSTTVTGTIKNDGTGGGTAGVITSTTANLTFSAGGVYEHAVDGATIPTATWNAASTCNVTGVTGNDPGGLTGQTFGHFIWNCSGQTANMSSPSAGLVFAGDLTIQNTSTFQFRFGQPGNNTIGGNFIMSGGNVRIGSGTARTVDVTGNVDISAGTLTMTDGNAIGTLNVAGNFSHTGGTITESGSASGAIVFNGTGTQTYTSGGTVSNTINFTVNSGATLQMAAAGTTVTGAGLFTLSSGAKLGITSPEGITTAACGTGGTCGNIRTTTRTFNTGASYIYNGSAAQNTGNGLPATVSNLTFDNTGEAVTLNSARTITNDFSITTGSIANLGTFTHTANTLTLGGMGQVNGSWGSTTSPATHQNNTYFAATTGIVNVTTSSCPNPTIDTQPSSPAAVCAGTGTPSFTVAATGPGALTYQWQESTAGTGGPFANVANGGVYSGAITATLTITNPPFSMNGYAYRVVVTRSCGSSATSNGLAVLAVNPLPTITLGTSPSVCQGITSANLSYSATTNSPNQYSIDYDAAANTAGFADVTNAALPATPIVLVVPGAAGAATYNATLTVRNSTTGCVSSPSTAFTVTVLPNPTATASAPSPYNGAQISCFPGQGTSNNGSATVTPAGGTPGYTYDWNGTPAGDGTATITGLVAGTYTVTVTDANLCFTTTTVTLTGPIEIIAFTCNYIQDGCQLNEGEIQVVATGGTGALNATWTAVCSSPPGPQGPGGPSSVPITFTGLTGNCTYSIKVTDANGCIDQ